MKTKEELKRDKDAFGIVVLVLALMLIFILFTSGRDITKLKEENENLRNQLYNFNCSQDNVKEDFIAFWVYPEDYSTPGLIMRDGNNWNLIPIQRGQHWNEYSPRNQLQYFLIGRK